MLELWIKNLGYNTVMNLILIFKPKICNKNIIKSNQAIIKRITRSVINVVINTTMTLKGYGSDGATQKFI